ncbi:unnamed protein product [Oikopleura dioica]|uniref:Alpha-carbonic anhydrase domain-containing protein n=1 Tax=Oikopleura dioica TaxID=34765 RepID=E4XS94_OIKDI|nr:unnamed protein product [Oikopleura dioica]CBY32437.1 unnamed protein product [Oikopleura dioica]
MKLFTSGLLAVACAQRPDILPPPEMPPGMPSLPEQPKPTLEPSPEPEPEAEPNKDTYYKPNSVEDICENGHHQSPIDLSFVHNNFMMHEFTPATALASNMSAGYDKEYNWQFKSDGHTIFLFLEDEESDELMIHEEDAHYKFDHFTFRWGDLEKGGSDHTVNHAHAFGEIQAWHRMHNMTHDEAVKHESGFRVISAFVELCEVDSSPFMKDLSRRLRTKAKNEKEDGKLEQAAFSFNSIFKGVDPHSYYFYHGSHTHPKHGDCSESVEWVIMQDPIRITKDTAKNIMKMSLDEEGNYIRHNNRPTQPWNDRQVHHFSNNPQATKMIMSNRRMFDMTKRSMGKKMSEMEEKIMRFKKINGKGGKKTPKNGGKKSPISPRMKNSN